MDTYETSPSWFRYKALLESQFGLNIANKPVETWRQVRGHIVHVDDWQPATQKGTLILVHGGGGNGRILAPICDVAASLGWRALAPDLPGYGLTRPVDHFRWDYEEWPAVIAALADETPGPVVLMGLSVGGMTALFAAEAARQVQGVIATTLIDMGDPAIFMRAARWRALGAASLLGFRLTPWLADRIALPLRLAAPMHAMSSDPEMQAYFMYDELLGAMRVPARFFRTMHARKAPTLKPRCPVLLVHPGADAWTPTALSRPAFERIEGEKEMVELSNGSHLPAELPARNELRTHIERFLGKLR